MERLDVAADTIFELVIGDLLKHLRYLCNHPFFDNDKEEGITDETIGQAVKKSHLSGKMCALASLLGAWRKQNRKESLIQESRKRNCIYLVT